MAQAKRFRLCSLLSLHAKIKGRGEAQYVSIILIKESTIIAAEKKAEKKAESQEKAQNPKNAKRGAILKKTENMKRKKK